MNSLNCCFSQFIFVSLIIAATISGCTYKDNNDSAQREADIVFQDSVRRCDQIKGSYTGTLRTTDNETGAPKEIEIKGGIYCIPSSKTSTDKEGIVISQMMPFMNLQRLDVPIPVTLEVNYVENSKAFLMIKPGSASSDGQGSGSAGGGQSLEKPIPGSLAATIIYDPISSFVGRVSGDLINGNAYVSSGGTTAPIGELMLKKLSTSFPYSASAISSQTETALLTVVSKFAGMYYGCVKETQVRMPYNISVELTVRDIIIGGKSVKALRAVYKRYDILDEKTRTRQMAVVIDLLNLSRIAITMNSYADQGGAFSPDLSGFLTNLPPLNTVDGNDVFEGTYSSQLGGALGRFKLRKTTGQIQDCRTEFPPTQLNIPNEESLL